MERERERMGEDCPGRGRPKREIRDGEVGENINVFNGQTFIFDYCTCMLVGTVLVSFSLICIVSQSFAV